jgi:hypothetical protein
MKSLRNARAPGVGFGPPADTESFVQIQVDELKSRAAALATNATTARFGLRTMKKICKLVNRVQQQDLRMGR